RREQVPGCLHTRIESCLRWPREALVCVYDGAIGCFAGALSGVQKCPAVGRARHCPHTSYLVVFVNIAHATKQVQSRGFHLGSRAGCAGFWLDVEAFDRQVAAKGCNRATVRARTSAARCRLMSSKRRLGDLASKSQTAGLFFGHAGEHGVVA
ncbi:unnamed protein product, partial [Ectocarpus fasciculatus]